MKLGEMKLCKPNGIRRLAIAMDKNVMKVDYVNTLET